MDRYRQLQTDSDSTRAPQRLLARAIRGYQAGILGAAAIARLRGVSVEAVERELQETGIFADPLESMDDPLPVVGLNSDDLEALLGSGPEPSA